MSRKMIDYKVEEGKITSIDGYKVGGDELTGDAIMGVTKDSDTVTRTLDTDGKVTLNAKGGGGTIKVKNVILDGFNYPWYLSAKSYDLNECVQQMKALTEYTADKPVFYIPSTMNINSVPCLLYTVEPEGETGPKFECWIQATGLHLYDRCAVMRYARCIRAGTLTKRYEIKYDYYYTKVWVE